MATKAWYRDACEENPQSLHRPDPPQYLSPEELYKKTGVKYEKIPEAVCDDKGALERISTDRKCKHSDFIDITEEDMKKMATKFYSEHLHEDAEIRLVTAGGGFFEVRSVDDRWVRVHVEKGDLLDLPPGIWHRFWLDDKNFVRLFRLYYEIGEWAAHYRSADGNPPARERYRQAMATVA